MVWYLGVPRQEQPQSLWGRLHAYYIDGAMMIRAVNASIVYYHFNSTNAIWHCHD